MSAAPKFTLDVHRMHDGVYCTLVLPQYSTRAVSRGFGETADAATLSALVKIPCGPSDVQCDHAECGFARATLAKVTP